MKYILSTFLKASLEISVRKQKLEGGWGNPPANETEWKFRQTKTKVMTGLLKQTVQNVF